MPPLDFNLAAYNVFLRPPWPIFRDGQLARARRLAAPLLQRDHDAIALAEAFHPKARRILLDGLAAAYPHRTLRVGARARRALCGGILVVSRWPIEAQAERLFDVAATFDRVATKGVVYVRIRKGDRPVHVFATHVNAGTDTAAVRARQFATIRRFIDDCRIPSDEPVLLAGDLNVDPTSEEYPGMLAALGGGVPPMQGPRYSFDPIRNSLATGRRRELLDYVLYSARHLAPAACSFEVTPPQTPPWRERWWQRQRRDLSDHYPVVGRFRFDDSPA